MLISDLSHVLEFNTAFFLKMGRVMHVVLKMGFSHD